MIALILGAALAHFLVGVDARPIRNPFKAPFHTLAVGVYDGLFPEPSLAGSGTMSGIGFPTGSVFPVYTGSSLISPTGTGSSPIFPTGTGLIPQTSTSAPPGFFVSLPFYTITVTQTHTLVQAPTQTSTLPTPSSSSSSSLAGIFPSCGLNSTTPSLPLPLMNSETGIPSSTATSGNATSGGNAYTLVGNGPISLPATIVIVPMLTTPAMTTATTAAATTATITTTTTTTTTTATATATTTTIATSLGLDSDHSSIFQSPCSSQSLASSTLLPTDTPLSLPPSGIDPVTTYPTPVASDTFIMTPTTTPLVSSTVLYPAETTPASSSSPVILAPTPPYGNSSIGIVSTSAGGLPASPTSTGIPTFTTETATITTTDTAIFTVTSTIPITTTVPQQGTFQPETLQQAAAQQGNPISEPPPLGVSEEGKPLQEGIRNDIILGEEIPKAKVLS